MRQCAEFPRASPHWASDPGWSEAPHEDLPTATLRLGTGRHAVPPHLNHVANPVVGPFGLHLIAWTFPFAPVPR